MEFSSQPFDISHHDTVAMSPLFGLPTFRWLPAKSKIESRFLLFYARVPKGFTKIDDVTMQGGKLTIVDHSGETVVLAGVSNRLGPVLCFISATSDSCARSPSSRRAQKPIAHARLQPVTRPTRRQSPLQRDAHCSGSTSS
jgi:hypothetical protein